MHKLLAVLAAVALSLGSASAIARGAGGHNSHTAEHSVTHAHGTTHAGKHGDHGTSANPHPSKTSKDVAVAGVQRDPNGKIHRSDAAKGAFKNEHPCPATGKSGGACPGYVIDHVKPLKRGGADSPSNMQWQTTAAAKAKDKTE